jgi:uncharacterized 2Fe-2S/4Fe-4S cluster protein (DUF4445 family)
VDVGTSRVVVRLVDLVRNRGEGEIAFDNPQSRRGPDVLARIHHAEDTGGLAELQSLIVDGIQRALEKICRDHGATAEDVCLVTAAGNTAMTHLLLGLPPGRMIREPYVPAVNAPGLLRADEIGLSLRPGARLMVFPNVGSYFGGDLVSGILFSGMSEREATTLLVDVGTNAEVVLGNRNWLIACAGAAGPALEGGVARMGMMAGPGVIDRVHLEPDSGELMVHTIGETPPKGICGSGLIDLAAALFTSGRVDIRGKWVPERCGRRLRRTQNGLSFDLVPAGDTAYGGSLSLQQADMDSLVRSKAAMFTILETLTGTVGISFGDIDTFYVAGTFGSFIDPRSAITIGMLPDLPPERFSPLGNSSLEGAVLALSDRTAPERIARIRDRITYLELNVNQDFMNRFSAARFLPHTDRGRFPSVSVHAAGGGEDSMRKRGTNRGSRS